MARAKPMIPGTVAMFASCSSERSASIAAKSSRSAKRRAGTRMSCREATGISHSVSSIRRSSDIEHRPCPDPAFFRAELELVVRDGLHEMRRSAPEALYGGVQTVARQLERGDRLGHEILGFCQDDQFVEPVGQERCPLRRAKRDLMTGGIPARGLVEELGERGESCGEELGLLGGLERELELPGVLD